jgi:hypothetical protein
MMKKLPIGIQSFEDLRSNDYLYVDKTEIIHRMISTGKIYFLSRPRRFGKSLLISTLDALFKGKKKLFKGLYIYDKWNWSKKYPVVRLDWTQIDHSSLERMEISMTGYLNAIAMDYQITLTSQSASDCFRDLIRALKNKTKNKVVILIDEYDKPITSHLSDDKLEDIQAAVHDFYQVMKGSDEYIRFILLTGVSKFSGLSIFSALNNPDDITLDENFVTICGYTQEELESYFVDYVDNLAGKRNENRNEVLDDIKEWYNGYSWDGKTSVYNPFSTLSLFKKGEFKNYWFATGTPTFLVNILRNHNQIKHIFESVETGSNAFESYDPVSINEIPLLFQTGYLTIKSKTEIQRKVRYSLGVPNSEVSDSFSNYLLNAYCGYPVDQLPVLVDKMKTQIENGDTSGLEQNLRMLLANIPSILHVPLDAYYHSMFLLLMKVLGFDVRGEVLTNIGRIDVVLHQPDCTIVAEVKHDIKKTVDVMLREAMNQIRDKKYYEAYLDRKVVLLAVAFTGKEVKCELKKLN